MSWFVMAFQKYAEFKGRSRRTEYWMFQLFTFIICVVFYIPGLVLVHNENSLGMVLVGIYLIYALAAFIPGLALSARRLHDTGKSGWWILIAFVPIIGG